MYSERLGGKSKSYHYCCVGSDCNVIRFFEQLRILEGLPKSARHLDQVSISSDLLS